MNEFIIGQRKIGTQHSPLVIAELGINHGGNLNKALQMIDDAYNANCECIKIQSHIIEDEMIPNNIVPNNANESIWEIIKRCSLTADEERKIKKYTEEKNMIFLSTPFSRAAAIRLQNLEVQAFKIGSGECNNYPLVEYIAQYGKPVILSTGMNTIKSITKSVDILRKYSIPFALMHCVSIYPTPYDKIKLEVINELKDVFSDAVLGLSDHSSSIYPCFGAVALGASIIEKHFISNKNWVGPDVDASISPLELKELINGSKIIYQSFSGKKEILKEEKDVINFAYTSVVSTNFISKGEILTENNIWVKRPGTGEISAANYNNVLGKIAKQDIERNEQIKWSYI